MSTLPGTPERWSVVRLHPQNVRDSTRSRCGEVLGLVDEVISPLRGPILRLSAWEAAASPDTSFLRRSSQSSTNQSNRIEVPPRSSGTNSASARWPRSRPLGGRDAALGFGQAPDLQLNLSGARRSSASRYRQLCTGTVENRVSAGVFPGTELMMHITPVLRPSRWPDDR